MKFTIIFVTFFISIISTLTSASPLYKQQLPYETEETHENFIRERRSPQNTGSISLSGGHTPGQGSFGRADYTQQVWQAKNGVHVDVNAFVQRNWGPPEPKINRGGGVSVSLPF